MKLTKRAEKLIHSTSYTPKTAPAICALVAFAAQNSGLDPANYGGGIEGYRALKTEQRTISADLRRFCDALFEASSEGVTDADIIAVAPNAFSGRLEWKSDAWNYCTGQYFPTEYRKAAAVVMEAAIQQVRQNRPAKKQMPRTIAELKALNKENGRCWFDRGSMRFFGTKIESGILRGKYFITSEQPPHGRRKYSIRSFDEEGSVDTVGEFCSYHTRAEAVEALSEIQ